MLYAVKLAITAIIVVAAAETAKRYPGLGAAIVALPLASMIAMSFLYYDTRDAGKVAEFSRSIPLAIIPSILFFYGFSFLIESQVGFVMAMTLATLIMLAGYSVYIFATR